MIADCVVDELLKGGIERYELDAEVMGPVSGRFDGLVPPRGVFFRTRS